jgi:serine/threonine protein kinase
MLVTDMGTAVLADFGLSKISHEAANTTLLGVGSPRWMSPELILGGDEKTGPLKTQKSDVYAYGHVMLEVLDSCCITAHCVTTDILSDFVQVLSNKLPFFHLKEDLHVLVQLIRGERSPRPDGQVAGVWLDDSAWAFCRRCTAVDPEERPGMEAVAVHLHQQY